MKLELRHLRSFLAVAEELHFGRAAKRLHMAQPPLSQQIRRLEDELGVELFDRGGRPIRLTSAGTAFLEEAQLAIRHADRAVQRSRRAVEGKSHVTVGATFWALSAIVPAVLRRFRAVVPRVTLDLITSAPPDLVESLEHERLDVSFVAFAEWSAGRGRALRAEPLLEEPMMAIVPEDHEFAGRAAVSLEELAGESFVTFSHAVVPGLVNQQMAAFSARGVAPVDVHETSDPWALLGLVAAGVGVGLHMASFGRVRHPGVAFVPLEGDAPKATLLLLWRRADERGVIRTFVDVAREVARSGVAP